LILPRVYPILDTGTLERIGLDPVSAAASLLEGGARILQFRHKGFWNRDTFAHAQQIAALCRDAAALFVINDRADYAMLTESALHLGQEDLLPADARTVLGPAPVIGFSTHNSNQMRAAQTEPVDYIAFGPVFATTSKNRADPVVGVETLRAIRALSAKPLVAIGGITRDNASHCWNAGADSVAVIGDFYSLPCDKRTLRERMVEWHQLSSR
jgi:thiamine-phosphate pyrophosphorylase